MFKKYLDMLIKVHYWPSRTYFKGSEKVIDHYRNIYSAGVDPVNFLNEFLEILYYIKNISHIKINGTSFSLNDSDYKKINLLSKKLLISDIMLFWQFTLKTLKEIDIVSNSSLLIEMYLIHTHLNKKYENENKLDELENSNPIDKIDKTEKKSDAISQMKNIKQEEENIQKVNKEIKSLDDLIQLCLEKEIETQFDLKIM